MNIMEIIKIIMVSHGISMTPYEKWYISTMVILLTIAIVVEYESLNHRTWYPHTDIPNYYLMVILFHHAIPHICILLNPVEVLRGPPQYSTRGTDRSSLQSRVEQVPEGGLLWRSTGEWVGLNDV